MNTTINHDSPTATRFDRVRMCALATAAVAPCALAVLWLAAPDCLMNALRSKERDADLRKQTTKKVEIVDDSRLPNDDWRAKLDALYPVENFNDRLDIPAPPAPELDDDYDLAAKMEEFVPSDDFANFDPGDAALPEAPHTDDIALRDEYDDSLHAVSAFDVAAPDSFDDEIARNAPPQNAGAQGEIAPNEAAPDDIAQSEIVPSEIVPSEVAQSDVLSNETAPNEIVPNEVAPNEVAPNEIAQSETNAMPSLAESNPLAPVSEEEVFGDFFASTNDADPLPPAPSPERPLPVDALPEPEPVEAPTYALDAGNDAVLADAAPVAPVSNFDIPLTEESPAPALDASNALPSALPNALPPAPNQVAATGRQTPNPGLEQPISPQQKIYPQEGLVAQESKPSPEVNAIAAQPPLPSVGESTSAYLETPSAQAAPAEPAEPIAPDAQAFASNDAQAAPSSEIADNSESLTDAEREAARRIAAYDLVAATEPSYFSRAFDLYGGSNAFSMLNFARAAKIIDEGAAFNPRAISSAFDAPPKFLANASANETTNEPAIDDSYPPELAFNPNPIEPEESTAPASPAPAPETSPELAPAPESAPTSNAPAEPNAAPEVGAQVANSNKVALVGYEEKPKAPRGANVGYIAKSSTQRGSNPVASLESELGALGLIGARVERWDAARWRASGARSLGENGGLEFRQGFGASPREAVDSLKQDLNASNVR